MMADLNDGFVSPVGAVWHYIRDNHPEIGLYTSDGSHPSQMGSYAAACTFYSVLLRKDPTEILFDYTLPDSTANVIRNAAKTVVFDVLEAWKVGEFDPMANFSFTQTEEATHFTNSSLNFEELSWDFGDGNSSMESDPIYNYPNTNAVYDVSLIASYCGLVDTFTSEVSIMFTDPIDTTDIYIDTTDMPIDTSQVNSIYVLKTKPIRVYPNPIDKQLFIAREKAASSVSIINTKGKLIKEFRLNTELIKLDTSNWASGVYFVKVKDANNQVIQIEKIVK